MKIDYQKIRLDNFTVVGVSILSTVVGLLGVGLIFLLSGLVGLIARDAGWFSITLVLLLILFGFFIHPAILENLSAKFEWVPNFTYWQWFAINIVSAFLNASGTSNNDKK